MNQSVRFLPPCRIFRDDNNPSAVPGSFKMKKLCRSAIPAVMLAAVILAVVVQPAAAKQILFGTTGACNNKVKGGPCTQNSTLVQIDPDSGALIRVIGPVGFTVNGTAWDRRSQTLYASTAIGCGLPGSVCPFHGLITIDTLTGAGYPVDPTVHNFGLAGADSPIHSITIDGHGRMVGWYDEFPPPVGVTDTFVKINKKTGIATEFPNTGIDTAANGLSFDEVNYLWNIDTARADPTTGVLTQTAYLIDPFTGKPFVGVALNPPVTAALGDFNPKDNLYYGIDLDLAPLTFIIVVNPRTGTNTVLGQSVNDLHTLTFAKVRLDIN